MSWTYIKMTWIYCEWCEDFRRNTWWLSDDHQSKMIVCACGHNRVIRFKSVLSPPVGENNETNTSKQS